MYHPVIKRTATSLFISHLHLDQHHVSAIGLDAQWILNGSEFQLIRFAHSFQLIATAIRAHSLQRTRFKGYIVKTKEIAIALLTLTQRFAVKEQFYTVSRRYHIDRFHCMSRIVPVSYDIRLCLFRFHPSVPHHLMSKEGILRDAHGIHNTTGTIMFLATMMGIRI